MKRRSDKPPKDAGRKHKSVSVEVITLYSSASPSEERGLWFSRGRLCWFAAAFFHRSRCLHRMSHCTRGMFSHLSHSVVTTSSQGALFSNHRQVIQTQLVSLMNFNVIRSLISYSSFCFIKLFGHHGQKISVILMNVIPPSGIGIKNVGSSKFSLSSFSS